MREKRIEVLVGSNQRLETERERERREKKGKEKKVVWEKSEWVWVGAFPSSYSLITVYTLYQRVKRTDHHHPGSVKLDHSQKEDIVECQVRKAETFTSFDQGPTLQLQDLPQKRGGEMKETKLKLPVAEFFLSHLFFHFISSSTHSPLIFNKLALTLGSNDWSLVWGEDLYHVPVFSIRQSFLFMIITITSLHDTLHYLFLNQKEDQEVTIIL